ncbi:tetratricopeptide repeat protein [bacterium]|nr:tetratricopeptide repeat protein [bacterium]
MLNNLKEIEKLCEKKEYLKAEKQLKTIKKKITTANELYDYYKLYGICEFEKGKYKNAIKCFLLCLRIHEENCLESSRIDTLHELSISYFRLYEITAKNNYLIDSIEYCKKAVNEGIMYSIVEKHSGFMTYFLESSEKYLLMLCQLGTLYQTIGDYDNAIKILEITKVSCQRFRLWRILGTVYDELGNIYQLINKPELAGYYYVKSINAKKIINNDIGIEISLRNHLLCMMRNQSIINNKENIRLQNILKDECI